MRLYVLLFLTCISYIVPAQTDEVVDAMSREDSLEIVNAVLQKMLVESQQREQEQLDSIRAMALNLEYQLLRAKASEKMAELKSLEAKEKARQAAEESQKEFSSQSSPVYISVTNDSREMLKMQIRRLVYQRDSVQNLLLEEISGKD